MRTLKKLLYFLLLVTVLQVQGQQSKLIEVNDKYFPNHEWEEFIDPSQLGYDIQKLGEARDFFESTGANSALVIHKGRILANWGDNTRRLRAASIRKSFLNSLIGIEVEKNTLNLESEIGKFDLPGFEELSVLERGAKIKDLMTTSSGIYLPAAYEPQVWTDRKPKRGTHAPGAHWYYNNWDFNVLGALYNQVTQSSIENDFKKKIADRIGMQDFRPSLDFKYFYEEDIPTPAYLFKMSSRDMARFGLLYLRKGVWNDEQLVPKHWIAKSTSTLKTPWEGVGYGYLWWTDVLDDGTPLYYASGTGVQSILVVPEKDLVMVFRANTYTGPEVPNDTELKLLNKIVAAKKGQEHKMAHIRNAIWNTTYTNGSNIADLQNWTGSYKNNIARNISMVVEDGNLVLKTKIADFIMHPLTQNTCWVEDLNVTAVLEETDVEEPTSTLTKEHLLVFKPNKGF